MENLVVETTGEQRPLSLIRLAVLLSTHLLWPSEQVSGKVTLVEQKKWLNGGSLSRYRSYTKHPLADLSSSARTVR